MSLQLSRRAQANQILRAAIYLAFGLAISTPSFAAIPSIEPLPTSTLPSSIDAARSVQPLMMLEPPKASFDSIVPKFTPLPVSAAAAHISFKLKRLTIVGATVYGDDQLAALFQNYSGHVISLADLQRIADNITLKYRHDGYILSKAIIPAQQITAGIVKIQIIEGYVNNVDIQGNPGNARALLERYGERLKAVRPLNIKTLERYTLLADDIPGLDLKTVISAAQAPNNVLAPANIAPGATNLTFIAAQHTAEGYLSYDNRGTKYVGPQQYTLGGNLNSMLRSGDQTSVQGLVTQQENELQYLSVAHKTPLGTSGATLNLTTSYTRNNPGYTLEPFNVQGRSLYAAAGVTYPVIRSRERNLHLDADFDYLNNHTDLKAFDLKLYNDRIRSLRFGGTLSQADHWLGINEMTAQLSQGLKILNASPDDAYLNSRPAGRSDYTKANLTLSRDQGLSHNFSILTSVTGQYAFTPLLSAEQFSYGGSQFGQAYDPSEITGDHGAAAKVELRYNTQPGWRVLNSVQYFTFYDMGKVWNKNINDGLVPNESGTSTGIGLRANFTSDFSSTLELAKPLTRSVATTGNRNPRLFFSVAISGDSPSSTPNTTPANLAPATHNVAPYTGLTAATTNNPGTSNSVHSTISTSTTATNAQPTSVTTPTYEGLTPVTAENSEP